MPENATEIGHEVDRFIKEQGLDPKNDSVQEDADVVKGADQYDLDEVNRQTEVFIRKYLKKMGETGEEPVEISGAAPEELQSEAARFGGDVNQAAAEFMTEHKLASDDVKVEAGPAQQHLETQPYYHQEQVNKEAAELVDKKVNFDLMKETWNVQKIMDISPDGNIEEIGFESDTGKAIMQAVYELRKIKAVSVENADAVLKELEKTRVPKYMRMLTAIELIFKGTKPNFSKPIKLNSGSSLVN